MPEGLTRGNSPPGWRRPSGSQRRAQSGLGLRSRLTARFSTVAAVGCLALARMGFSLLLSALDRKGTALEQAARGGRALGPGERHQNGVNTSALGAAHRSPEPWLASRQGQPSEPDGSHHHRQGHPRLSTWDAGWIHRQIVHRPGCQEVHCRVLAQVQIAQGLGPMNDWGTFSISSMLFAIVQAEAIQQVWGASAGGPSSSPASQGETHPCRRRTRAAGIFSEGRWGPGDHLSHPRCPFAVLDGSKWRGVDAALRIVHLMHHHVSSQARPAARRASLPCSRAPALMAGIRPGGVHRWRAGSVDKPATSGPTGEPVPY